MNKYIYLLGIASKTRNHELLEECLNYYGVLGINELKEKQLEDFCIIKGLLNKAEPQTA